MPDDVQSDGGKRDRSLGQKIWRGVLWAFGVLIVAFAGVFAEKIATAVVQAIQAPFEAEAKPTETPSVASPTAQTIQPEVEPESVPEPPPSPAVESPARQRIISVTALLDPVERVGKDKGLARPYGGYSFFEPMVLGPEGQIKYNCHIYYEIFYESHPVPVGTGRTECHGSAMPWDSGTRPKEPGHYVLKMSVELDDGATASGAYEFDLLPG